MVFLGFIYDRIQKMRKKYLVAVAITIFIVFGIFAVIKKIKLVEEQSEYNDDRVSDIESQIQNLEYRTR